MQASGKKFGTITGRVKKSLWKEKVTHGTAHMKACQSARGVYCCHRRGCCYYRLFLLLLRCWQTSASSVLSTKEEGVPDGCRVVAVGTVVRHIYHDTVGTMHIYK